MAQPANAPDQDNALLTKLNTAVKAANEAETSVTAAQTELVSRSKVVGQLLLEAKKLHPAVKDFEAYLKRVDGLKLSRAYDLLRLAGGRTTDEELRKEARERRRKSRAKSKTQPKPPEKVSGTVPETAKESTQTPKENAAAVSARNLREFEYACRTYLPKLNEADLKKAHAYFMEGYEIRMQKPRKEAA
jgi:hypothetical protein